MSSSMIINTRELTSTWPANNISNQDVSGPDCRFTLDLIMCLHQMFINTRELTYNMFAHNSEGIEDVEEAR